MAKTEQKLEQNRIVFEDNVRNLLSPAQLAKYKQLDRNLSLSQRQTYMNDLVDTISKKVTNLARPYKHFQGFQTIPLFKKSRVVLERSFLQSSHRNSCNNSSRNNHNIN